MMHITLKNAELLKHSKLDKNAPTCFGLHRKHLQGAKVSAWLKIKCFDRLWRVQHAETNVPYCFLTPNFPVLLFLLSV